MKDLLDKAVKYIVDIFKEQWVVLLVALSALAFIFLVTLFLGLIFGDFNRCSRALKRIAKGDRERGIEKLKRQAPVYEKEVVVFPSPSDFDYDKIVVAPYSYSLIKSLKSVVFHTTLFCIVFAIAFSVILEGGLSTYSAFNILAIATLGFVLVILSSLFSRCALKKGSKRFFAMRESLVAENFDSMGKEAEILPSVALIFERIETAYNNKETSFDVLNDLYSDLKKESKKDMSNNNYDMLKEASEKLNSLIEQNNKDA